MILEMEVQLIKSSLGKTKNGAELTLADTSRPQCLVPFSFYVSDVEAFESANKLKITELRFKRVNVLCAAMESSSIGNGIKLVGELALGINPKETK